MHSSHLRFRNKGMTLLETLVVLAIAAAVMGGIMFMLNRQNERARNEDAVRIQGLEMSNLASAARQYGDTAGASWANGTRNEVTMATLITAGLLPDDFGARGSATARGVTPVGQQYRVFTIKDGGAFDDPTVPDGTIRTVILDLGTPVLGRLERAGVPNLADAILSFKEAIGLYTTREEKVPMAVLGVGATIAQGVGRVFTKDVLDWIANPPTTPAVVALVGFPDLDGDDTTGGPGETGPKYDDCQVIPDYYGCPGGQFSTNCPTWSPPSCPSGWVDLAHPRGCGVGGAVAKSTDVGMVVAGTDTVTQQNYGCKVDLTIDKWNTVSVGGAEIFRQHCTEEKWRSEWVDGDYGRTCQDVEHTFIPVSPTAVGGSSASYGLLCCLPRPR